MPSLERVSIPNEINIQSQTRLNVMKSQSLPQNILNQMQQNENVTFLKIFKYDSH